jgi:hypothetical protein
MHFSYFYSFFYIRLDSQLSYLFIHYLQVTIPTILFVFGTHYSNKIHFHIEARCPSAKCDS